MKRKLSKEDKKLRDRFKTVSRLLEAEEYEQLMASIKKERLLKQRIAELSRYRRNGITKLEDCSEFDILKQEQTKLREKKVFAHQPNHLSNRL
jgi:transcriptional adapter 2-beta